MSDKFYTTLGFIGFIFIAIIVAINWQGGNTEYEVQSAYEPVARADLMNSQDLYAQMTGSRALSCPTIDMPSANGGIINLSSIIGSYASNPYGTKCFIFPSGLLDEPGWRTPSSANLVSDLHLTNKQNTSGEVKFSELFESSAGLFNDTYPEIIAPFGFTFGNINSDVRDDGSGNIQQSIVIYNNTANCRITFGNVANWFCAGTVGTTSIKSNNSDGKIPWENHYTTHHSIIGNSANSSVKGGTSGSVIGYAKSDTTILIEAFDNGQWKKISLHKLIYGPNP